MKQVIALALVAGAKALPLLQPYVTNGLLVEVATPTFAAGIRTDCDYEEAADRNLGHVFAQGNDKAWKNEDGTTAGEHAAKKAAKVACDDMGPDCGGVVKNVAGEYQMFQGTALKSAPTGTIAYVKSICAFPLPESNFWKGENMHDSEAEGFEATAAAAAPPASTDAVGTDTGAPAKRNMGPGKVYKFNHGTNPNVEKMRWKLSNGPSYSRIDDGKDHGAKSRLVDGTSNENSIEDCMKSCAKRSDCVSGHYCESGEGAVSGKCFMSGDWDPYGEEPDYDGCDVYRNFKQNHDWVKPVLRLEDGNYVKEQWHSKVPIDVAEAQQNGF